MVDDAPAAPLGDKEQVELEIAAFMTPHINRARIALVVIGAIYAILGYLSFDDISKIRAAVEQWSSAATADPRIDEFKRAVTLIYVTVVFSIAAGIANIVLAVIAGKKTMLAFYAAAAIFIVHTLLQAYVTDGVVFTTILWWVSAIFLGMGFQAAYKAHKLRTEGIRG